MRSLIRKILCWWRLNQMLQRCPHTHKKCSRLRKRHGDTTLCIYCASWLMHQKQEWRGLD